MTPIIQSGSQAFLQQAHRNNWQRYLASLGAQEDRRTDIWTGGAAVRGWDLCVLTASDGRQAAMIQGQLDRRRAEGLLPEQTRFHVVADPDGKRIGSGGATLRILAALYGNPATQPALPADLAALSEQPANRLRILVIHSGGDSRRLPHCSAIGKLFARIPRVLPDGRASTIFDELLINLSGVATGSPPGILLVSGDVLLIFDHLQLSFHRHGVTGVAVAVPADMGQRHGVYVTQPGQKLVHAFLHKASAATLAAWHAVDDRGNVPVDTGLVWLDPPTAQRWARLLATEAVAALCHWGTPRQAPSSLPLNLYGDLLLPQAPSTQEPDYMADASEGAPTPELLAARRVIWPALRSVPFGVERLEPAVFVHFGSSEEYWRMVAADAQLAHLCGWTQHAAGWLEQQAGADALVLINSILAKGAPVAAPDRPPALITDSYLAGLEWRGHCIVAGVEADAPIDLAPDLVLHQLPVRDGYVTRLFGLLDDPKRHWSDAAATFLNRPWNEWLAAEVEPTLLWPHVPPVGWTLWNARLFPLLADRGASLRLALALQNPAQAGAGWRTQWAESPRLSLAEGFVQADGERILAEIAALEDEVVARRVAACLEREHPATELTALLHSHTPAITLRRGQRVAAWLAATDPVLQWRGYRSLAAATGEAEWEERAFAVLAHQIESTVTQQQPTAVAATGASPLPTGSMARVEAAARIDFGGGWTDTPPYSLERGGTVLNAAILLEGGHPIVVEGSWLPEPRIVLESLDIGESLEPVTAGEIRACTNPADPFALLKAAILLKGIVPADCAASAPVGAALRQWPGGLRLRTQTSIPRGSGLGTSSILAGAVLACLDRLLGLAASQARLFDEVLWLEQMLTTGGGWQDQAGGLIGGIKLVATEPGLQQALAIHPVTLPASSELRDRLLLVYTGQQRLAKNLLRAVMSRWMLRDPEMVWLLGEIGRLALAMRDALSAGDVDGFGELIATHWELNKRMDPGCTNPFIDDLFHFMRPYIRGAKLAGAGGGGFAIVVADGAGAAAELTAALAAHYAGTPVRVWPHAIPTVGLRVT